MAALKDCSDERRAGSKSRFSGVSSLIEKRHRWIILTWMIIFLVSLTMVSGFLSSVNTNITSAGGPSNTESQKAQNILNSQFPALNNNTDDNLIIVILQGGQPYSDAVKNAVLALNQTLTSSAKVSNYTGMTSIYTEVYSELNSIVPSLLQEAASEAANVSSQQNVTLSQAWTLASSYVANAATGSFSGSPLFAINDTSLALLLSSLSSNSTQSQIEAATLSVISNQSFSNYPLLPTPAVAASFITPNQTMVFTLNFTSYPSSQTISLITNTTNQSQLKDLGTVYITGTPPFTQDVTNEFTPALLIIVGVGLIAALVIVGLLFLAPIAALIPLFMGGLSITIAFSAIYLALVRIGHQSLSFLTPTTTSILMLGLAIDYSVLQLRRTREERLKGRTIGESIDFSMKWAGQAVLTAGITVIIAYFIMAAANVPVISGVGVAIAIGVSILLLMSLTLLPSLEYALGDRLFWPRKMETVKDAPRGKSRLRKIAEATLKRKVAIAIIISLIALVAFVTYLQTPKGENELGLLPNSPSVQGLTVYTNGFGSGSFILITTPTPIVYGGNQFNQTLLNQIQEVSAAAQNSSGVLSVMGPTMPLGVSFNYTALGDMSAPVRAQYESEMISFIGQNNETAYIKVNIAYSEESAAAVNSLRGVEKNIAIALPDGLKVYYGGTTQQTYDSESLYGDVIPEIVGILAAAIYAILFVQLRSAFTPIRLIFTVLCSVGISLATLSIVFYYALDLPIVYLAPLFAIVTMLGVGIDYDIFFVTRIREEVINGKSDDEAIKTAVDKTWLSIVGMGLVLFCTFGGEILTGIPLLQEIGLTVAAAILIDMTIVILFFVPSLMGLAQKFNWWPSKRGKGETKQ